MKRALPVNAETVLDESGEIVGYVAPRPVDDEAQKRGGMFLGGWTAISRGYFPIAACATRGDAEDVVRAERGRRFR